MTLEERIHRFLDVHELQLLIEAFHGVNPCEPESFWAVEITDLGGNSLGKSDGESLLQVIDEAIESVRIETLKEYESTEGYPLATSGKSSSLEC